jgi:hypothetical protein
MRAHRSRGSRGFRVFCEVVDAKRDATILTYHEGKSLSSAAPGETMKLELQTTEPIRSIDLTDSQARLTLALYSVRNRAVG